MQFGCNTNCSPARGCIWYFGTFTFYLGNHYKHSNLRANFQKLVVFANYNHSSVMSKHLGLLSNSLNDQAEHFQLKK